MDGQQIPFSDSVKYLGVTLDNKLTWKTHLEEKTTACKKLMVMPNSNLRGMHAPKPKLSKWAYTGVVRPKLLYAHDLGKLNKHNTTTKETKSIRQTSN